MTFEEIKAACSTLFIPGQVTEVRALGKWGTASGYFNDVEKLASAVQILENRGEYAGIYVTLNPVNPDLLARRANRMETKLSRSDSTTGDADIISRRWLPIDIDPVRPSGVSSSGSEHEAAIEKAGDIAGYLTGIGWPQPVIADSGNGAHLLFRVDLQNDDNARDQVKGVLETIHLLFSDTVCQVDRAVFNAGRIWKLYGTTSRKGDNIADRPHRPARIISVPDGELGIVTGEQLSAICEMIPKDQPEPVFRDRRRGEQIELGTWLTGYGISYTEKPFAGGTLFVLDDCPFSSAHTDGAYAIQFQNGAIFAGCHHSSCGGGSQRWAELREKFEGTVEERIRRNRLKPREEDEGEGASEASPRLASGVPSEIQREATRILSDGSPFRYMLDTFSLDHIGDPVVAECLAMSLASRQVINAKGLHVSVTGESGKGKSHAFDTMMLQVPEELRLEGRMSDKALFYIKDMKPGTVIVLDDVTLSDAMQEVLKGVTTSFKKPFKYRTVDKDRGGKTCIIPERCVWWVAKVEGTGDDQVWNRMLTCWIDDSEDQDAKVLAQTLDEAAAIPVNEPGVRPELEICKEMWRAIAPVWVVVPFAKRIRFSTSMNRRNPDMLLDLVKAHAVLMQNQRERSESGNMVIINATVEDFRNACRLYRALNGTDGGQQSKLTRRESELVEAIMSRGLGEITVSEMQHITGWSYSVIHKMLHGSVSRGHQYSGLLEKCPAISVCDRTLVTDEGGLNAAHRRSKAYAWDPYVYECWISDDGCWIDGYHSDDQDRREDPSGGGADDNGRNAKDSTSVSGDVCDVEEDNLSNSKIISTHNGESVSMKQGIGERSSVCTHIREQSGSASVDQSAQSDDADSPVFESGGDLCSHEIRNLPAAASVRSPGSENSEGSGSLLLSGIRSEEFTGITGGFGTGPCDCCGSKWVNYQERMTSARLKEAPRMNRKICKKCYERVLKAESLQVRVLPGVLNPELMTRISKDLGKCEVCGRQKATRQDPETKTVICEICYQNLPGIKEAAYEKTAD